VAVIQRFLPALRAGRGRVVNVSSIGGRVALPLVGAYNMSKFALEGLSDSLRRELRPQAVDVVVIEPGGVKTPIWKKGNELADDLQAGMPPEAARLYGPMVEALRAQTVKIERERGIDPSEPRPSQRRSLPGARVRATSLAGTRGCARAWQRCCPTA
jgi:NAD(P)-dependent dehydrogenase (short-subunit alcohol dehydrogenase family)